ncbi:hypothetical protein C7G52_19065, partial [Acinetobacter baumannii]
VLQDGSDGKPASQRHERAGARGPAIGARFVPRPSQRRFIERPKGRTCASTTARVGTPPEPSDGPAHAVPHPTGAHRQPPSASLPAISSTL